MLLSKIIKKSVVFISILAMFALSGCWPIPDKTTATPTTGQITVWTNKTTYTQYVSIDGVYVGALTAYRTTAPTCGASTAGAVTKTVDAGTHYINAYDSVSTWPTKYTTVSGGGCNLIELCAATGC